MVKPSERLGNYEVSTAADGTAQILGSGAGGVTYRGTHIHLGTEVAIKVLIRRKNLLQKDRDAFLSEARSAASLTHPQIARILDFGESAQQHPYYVMELCEGGSLEEFGNKTSAPDEYSCIQWMFESAAALAHAHQKGILHRDIKPSNLLVARQNESASVKLIDFGLADHAEQSDAQDHVIGTPHFAAPEQLRGHAEPASDVFSLGATFLWLMTGKHLSQGDVKNVISERLDAVTYAPLLASLPATWQNLLGRMLEVDPSRRPRDGGEVLAVLQTVFPNHPGDHVPWDASADGPGTGSSAPAPSQWEDCPDTAWSDRWIESGTPVAIEYGVSVSACRTGSADIHEVSKFTGLPPDIANILTDQADQVARHAQELGLGNVILERGADWWSVAWPALGSNDALSWVRQGQSATTAEILAALDPIAFSLDGMKSAGFEHLEVHPSMLIVGAGAPLKFSLAVPLPVLSSADQAADSAGTMRGAMGASLSSRFAACVYQLLSGRTVPPAAFVNSRAYQAIPKLAERSNRFLSSAIAGSLAGSTCRDVIRGLAHEERIPGASHSGSRNSGASLGGRSTASWQSNPSISIPGQTIPAHTPQPVPPSPPPPDIPHAVPALTTVPATTPASFSPEPRVPPKPTIVESPARKKKLPIAAIAAAGALVLGGAAWYFIPKRDKPPASASAPASAPSTPTTGVPATISNNSPAVVPTPTPTDTTKERSVVKVPDEASTITEALKLCASGGTIEITGGTHTEAIVLTKSVSIVSKAAAVLEDAGLKSCLLTARGPIQVTLRNIQIKNTQKQASQDVGSSPSLVLITDGASVTFEGCVIEGSVGDGISLADTASATFSNCRIRKNRGVGINISSGSKVNLSLSEVQENGGSGIAVSNVGSTVTLGSGATISSNSEHGVEIGNGAQLLSSGAEIKSNQKVGILVESSGSLAKLEASCVISENRKYGLGVRDAGRLILLNGAVEDNSENGIYVESGGQAEITSSRFKSNGAIGIYLVGGSTSAVTVSKATFESHSDAGVAFVEGVGKVSESRFTNNTMALFYGKGSRGTASGNIIHPGPIEDTVVTENAGEVVLQNNTVEAAP